MLSDEEHDDPVSDEDFSMTSEPEEKAPELSLAQLILQNKEIQAQVQAALEEKKRAKNVPDRIKLLPDEPHGQLRENLKLLWKDKCRMLTLNHCLAKLDCTGDQAAERELLKNFERRQAAYEAQEAKRIADRERERQEAKAAKAREQELLERGSDWTSTVGSGGDSSDDDAVNEDGNSTDGGGESKDGSALDTGRTSLDTEAYEQRRIEMELAEEQKRKEEEARLAEERDSDDDYEDPPEIPDITLAFVCNVMREKEKLEVVQFDENPLGKEGMRAFCRNLKTLPSLTVLNLSAVEAGPKGATALADALRGSMLQRTVINLTFGFNSIGPEGCTAVAETVGRRCRALETLRLHSNEVKSDGAVVLARELLRGERLCVLDLGDNAIGDRGVESLAEYVIENKALRRLNLNQNTFTHRGAAALAGAMQTLREAPEEERLQRLNMSQCRRVNAAGIDALQNAAKGLQDAQGRGFKLYM